MFGLYREVQSQSADVEKAGMEVKNMEIALEEQLAKINEMETHNSQVYSSRNLSAKFQFLRTKLYECI